MSYRLVDDFQLHKIFFNLDESLDTKQSSQVNFTDVEKILNQKFSYFGFGHHAYAFVSEDNNYVLKIPRFHKFKTRFWIPYLEYFHIFDRIRIKRSQHLEQRIQFIFNSHKIAEDLLQEQTGILYLHLGKTSCFKKNVTLIDKIGRKFSVDLDSLGFVLQKKFTLYKQVFPRLIKEGKYEEVQQLIKSCLQTIALRAQKLVMNKDRGGWGGNYGVLNDSHTYELDLGAFVMEEKLKDPSVFHWEMYQCSLSLRKWMEKHRPEMLIFFDEEIQRLDREYSKMR